MGLRTGMVMLISVIWTVAGAAEDARTPPDPTLSYDVPSGITSILEDLQELRLERRENLLEFELKGRDSSRRKIEKVEEEQAEVLRDLGEAVDKAMKSYRRDIERNVKRIMRYEDQLVKVEDDPDKSAELEAKIDALKQVNEPPRQILDAIEAFYADSRDAVKGLGSRTKGLWANTGADAPRMSLSTLDGEEWPIDDAFADNHLVLVFWSTANDDSIRALELLAQAQEELKKANTVVVGVAIAESPESINAVQEALRQRLKIVQMSREEAHEKHVDLVPLTLFIEEGGTIQSAILGYTVKLASIMDDVLDDLEAHRAPGQDDD